MRPIKKWAVGHIINQKMNQTILSLYNPHQLAKTHLELESNKINDVLSILLPKFVKDQMD